MQKRLISTIIWIKKFSIKTFNQYDDWLPYIIISLIALMVFVGGIKLLIGLTEELKSQYLTHYDTSISEYVASYRTPLLTKYFVFVTDRGDAFGIDIYYQ